MNCVPVLQRAGYNLRGYSADTYFYLSSNSIQNEEECVSWLWYLEARYG
ncbi:hypothetical protein AZ270_gp04 [Acidianus tailed spindle virus]|nr:hypothetical protein AZ270_gp04 [Acidianus tailed spindle virus]AME30027.1 hypothetical protein ATSV_B48 [Acidianus tailed spindle virus]